MTEISLGRYLFERVKQLGVDSVFGVPGDFTLELSDKISEVDGSKWIGNANELNAGYAADGYSRLKGMACLVTTFGVGESSTIAAVAGSYAEHVGSIHVVGTPSTSSQSKQLLSHHTLGNGDFTVFRRISACISKTTAYINDVATAAAEIDRVLVDAYIYQKPVYLAIPANFFNVKISAERSEKPLDLQLQPNDPEAEEEVVSDILEMISRAKNPVVSVDACASRHNVKEETAKFVDITQFPVFTTPMGKGAFNEHNPRFGGVYVGSLSYPEVKEAVESADLVLAVGGIMSDFNTGSFSYSYKTKNVVELHSDHIKIRNATYEGVKMKFVSQKLLSSVGGYVTGYKPVPVPKPFVLNTPAPADQQLTQEWLWTRLSTWSRSGDVVITETGTSSFGIVQTQFPPNTTGISQVLWGSIGYSVGSCSGAALAAEELDKDKRVILFVGDGSSQLTVQEISTMIKWGLKPILFVSNNHGYTIEKLIHGPNADYNEIQSWEHTAISKTFGSKDGVSVKVSTTGELNDLFASEEFSNPKKIHLVELMLPTMDAPTNLIKQAELSEKINRANN